MRAVGLAAGAAAIALVGSLSATTPAHADDFQVALNGTYRVMSDGEWAKRGMAPGGADVFFDQKTVVQTWTISTDCVSPIECTGVVHSDLGWTATIRLDDFWYIDHDIPDWLRCPDGSTSPGHQKFILLGWNPTINQRMTKNTDFLIGRDQTKGPSGACGTNHPVVIEMPVKVQKI
ncbi:hypothetical protein A5765_11915 [Mycolicibacterium celeriflavum]|uniref:Uncharacterized protein n=1 Tax=Mycolicibacterium celeriflavum TaxID=1249101 RepID=A0A1X0BPT5_MYCCF|nr:hypothetical protein [Mycolicibacterium celeriflavum]MCV7239767.1 hypothetical protein [Mycolicibacterium celeriflavum]OBG13626.1 hypothetical protein A5765_11915 [Mycolicibacterium celeriflavum]ORA44521.1 hypothetical protein BST21_19345 [Mycolicibacterium celeriflavum]BBY41749.1 hypothetical protein MCEL_00440 [Mycolicibacterium celeriflavum]